MDQLYAGVLSCLHVDVRMSQRPQLVNNYKLEMFKLGSEAKPK